MAKPAPAPVPAVPAAHPAHHLDLSMTVRGETFSLSGVFDLSVGMAAFDHWVGQLGGGGLTPAQLSDLLARAEAMASRLEGIDNSTP